MINNQWYQDAITSIYSRVRAITLENLKTEYANLKITDDESSISATNIPTVYIHALQPYERGQDLSGDSINAISLTFQVEVYAKNKMSAKKISSVVVDAFKNMRFSGTLPESQNNLTGVERMVSRYQRLIGSNDKI